MDEDTPIDAKMLSNAIENAQKQVESRNFQTRKNVLEYDDVMNTQREVIYKQRRQVLDGEDLQQSIQSMLRSTIENAIRGHMGEQKHMTAEEFREATALFHTMFLCRTNCGSQTRSCKATLRTAGGSGHGEGPGCLSTQGAGIATAPDAGAGAGHHAAGGGRVLDGPDRRHE